MAKSNNIEKLSGYELMRRWFDFAFENQDKVCPTHTAMFSWFVELNNRMGWADKFASPASQTMSAISLESYNTYKKIFDDLVKFRFVTVVSESKNQWSACIIALSNNDKTLYKALDNALMTHLTTQSESTIQSTSESTYSINKPQTINHKPQTKDIEEKILESKIDIEKICLEQSTQWQESMMRKFKISSQDEMKELISDFFLTVEAADQEKTDLADAKSHCSRWINLELEKRKINTSKKSVLSKFETLQETFNNTQNPYVNGSTTL